MKIGAFSIATGLSRDTIRYYEKIGILLPTMNKHTRDYDTYHQEIVDTIIKLKQTGFSLQEIKSLLDLAKDTDRHLELTVEEINNIKQMKKLFQDKYQQMLEQEKQIQETKTILQRVGQKLDYLLERNTDD